MDAATRQRDGKAALARAECSDEHARSLEKLAAELRALGLELDAQKSSAMALAYRCDARGHRADAARLIGQKEQS